MNTFQQDNMTMAQDDMRHFLTKFHDLPVKPWKAFKPLYPGKRAFHMTHEGRTLVIAIDGTARLYPANGGFAGLPLETYRFKGDQVTIE